MQAGQSTNAASCADFRLGPWLVEPSLGRLSAGGTTVRLRPLAMELLVFLARSAGRVVSPGDIRKAIWGRQFLAESALSRLIAEVRRTLGDDVNHPIFVETVSKRGYRLLPEVIWPAPHAGAQPKKLSIVVLPFTDMAPQRDQEYFCDGMAEELTNALTRLQGLRVIARTSAFAFKGKAVDIREIGRQLGVDVIVEGGVQKCGGRLRISVQAIEASDGGHIWSERFDRTEGDSFAIEDDLARSVVKALQVRLLTDERGRLPGHHSRNPDAHDLYLRGRHLYSKRTSDAVAEAIRCFEPVIRADPEYSFAYVALAECYATCGFLGFLGPGEAFPAARRAAVTATDLDPGASVAWAVLGLVSGVYEWQWLEAERLFRFARDAGPSCAMAHVWHAIVLMAMRRMDDSRAAIESAFDLDPLSPVIQANVGYILFSARDFDGALSRCRKAMELDPEHPLVNLHLGRTYMALGQADMAIEHLRKAARDFPNGMGVLAAAWAAAGRRDKADEVLAELHRMAEHRYVGEIAFFAAQEQLYGRDAAIGYLTRAFDAHEGIVPAFTMDPLVDYLRPDPRFQALLARLGIPEAGP